MNTHRTYAIRVDGHLDDHWSAWLGELDMTRNDDSSTTLTVAVADQPSSTAYSPACATSALSSSSFASPMRRPQSAGRCSSARCTPSAAPSVPPPPTTPTAVLGSGAVR